MKIFDSCREVDKLLSQALDEPLGFTDRMRLRIHLGMCGNCRNAEKQMDTLHALGPQLGSFDFDDEAGNITSLDQDHLP